FVWCTILNFRNRTAYQYFNSEIRRPVPEKSGEPVLENVLAAPSEEMAEAAKLSSPGQPLRAPMLSNYLFSALAGTTWYMQFFFYTMAETQMGRYKFSSWTLHM